MIVFPFQHHINRADTDSEDCVLRWAFIDLLALANSAGNNRFSHLNILDFLAERLKALAAELAVSDTENSEIYLKTENANAVLHCINQPKSGLSRTFPFGALPR